MSPQMAVGSDRARSLANNLKLRLPRSPRGSLQKDGHYPGVTDLRIQEPLITHRVKIEEIDAKAL